MLPFLITASFISVIIISPLFIFLLWYQLDGLVLFTVQIGSRVACVGIGDRHHEITDGKFRACWQSAGFC